MFIFLFLNPLSTIMEGIMVLTGLSISLSLMITVLIFTWINVRVVKIFDRRGMMDF